MDMRLQACMEIIHSGELAPYTPARPRGGTPTLAIALAIAAARSSVCWYVSHSYPPEELRLPRQLLFG